MRIEIPYECHCSLRLSGCPGPNCLFGPSRRGSSHFFKLKKCGEKAEMLLLAGHIIHPVGPDFR
jgi:hypothetical protein